MKESFTKTLRGCGANLKTNGTSHFWIYGENLALDDWVVLVRPGGDPSNEDDHLWRGQVKKLSGSKAKVHLMYVRSGTKGDALGDLADIDVTVTTSTWNPESNTLGDQAVEDGPE